MAPLFTPNSPGLALTSTIYDDALGPGWPNWSRAQVNLAASSPMHNGNQSIAMTFGAWQDGIPEYGQGGAQGLRRWLDTRGVQNVQALNAVLSKGAHPWWDFYGGREKIEVIDVPDA